MFIVYRDTIILLHKSGSSFAFNKHFFLLAVITLYVFRFSTFSFNYFITQQP